MTRRAPGVSARPSPSRVVVAALSSFVATLIVGCGEDAPAVPPALDGPDTVTLSTTASTGSPVVAVRIVGKGPYRFVVDTGAGASFVREDLARSLGLRAERKLVVVQDAGGKLLTAWAYVAGTVRLGELIARDVTFYATDDLPAFEVLGVDGMLGIDLLEGRLLALDPSRAGVHLVAGGLPEPDGRSILALGRGELGLPNLTLDVGGVDVDFTIDTGDAGMISLSTVDAERVAFASGLTGPVMRQTSMASTREARVGRLAHDVMIGRVRCERPVVTVSDTGSSLGVELLAALGMTLDLSNDRLGIGCPSDTLTFTGFRSSGVEFELLDGCWVLSEVMPGSEAERLGLTIGARIASIDGLSTDGRSIAELREAMFDGDDVLLVLEQDGRLEEHRLPLVPLLD